VVVYDHHIAMWSPIWALNIVTGEDQGPYRLSLQDDGNLVLYNKDGGDIWSSGTRGAARLQVQNDGNVVLYDADGNFKWATGSSIDANSRHLDDGSLKFLLGIEMQINAASRRDTSAIADASASKISQGLVVAGIQAAITKISHKIITDEAAMPCVCWMPAPSTAVSVNVHRGGITCPELEEFQLLYPDTFQLDQQCELIGITLPPIIAPVLLQLKSQSSELKTAWHNLAPDTKDADVAGLFLEGVTIVDGMMTEVNLIGRGLTGEIGDFSKNVNLTHLLLAGNGFTGPVPDFSKNTALQVLQLHRNILTGPVPDFSKNAALQTLILENNKLTSKIPSFNKNVNLISLNLAKNELTGSIPDFSKNVKLENLQLWANYLSGAEEWEANTSNYPPGCGVSV